MGIVEKIEKEIKAQFEGEGTGHDWHHIDRVRNVSMFISQTEGGDPLVVELAALLHDISDHKFNGGDLQAGGQIAFDLLIKQGLDEERSKHVRYIVDNLSYKGAETPSEMKSLEGQIVQDADRLDAIGAIGVARTFAYGGHKGQPIYEPGLSPVLHESFEAYANGKTSTINHFYEKLLLLSARLNTATAKDLGKQRHAFMETFLKQFYSEWNFNSEETND